MAGTESCPTGETGSFGPEDVFHYMYAVFHAPGYHARYAEFLKRDFPRLPLTGDLDLLRELCHLGEQLVRLHLMEPSAVDTSRFKLPGYPVRPNEQPPGRDLPGGLLQNEMNLHLGGGGDKVEKVRYNPPTGGAALCGRGSYGSTRVPAGDSLGAQASLPVNEDDGQGRPSSREMAGTESRPTERASTGACATGKVWINAYQYFDGVAPEVWGFRVGGYQPCEKWLKDRKDRRLTLDDQDHYRLMVAIIAQTIWLMGEIDAVIEAHGGWPLHS